MILEGAAMAALTIRLSEEDKVLIKSYAELHGTSVAEFVRSSLIERIKDEFDLGELNEAISESDGEFISHSEIMR
jgi:uncharacterized protein (DUF1778 family)